MRGKAEEATRKRELEEGEDWEKSKASATGCKKNNGINKIKKHRHSD